MRGEGEGSQLEVELPASWVETGLGAVFSLAASEHCGGLTGSQVSGSFASTSFAISEELSSSLKRGLMGDRELMISLSASLRSLESEECKLRPSMLRLI